MAQRLTDKKKKRIIADYVQLGSYNAVAKMHGVADTTVKRVVLGDPHMREKAEQKKEQNTADILDYMESQRDDVCKVLGICLGELKKPERYAKTTPQQIATTMAILIDKYTAFGGGPKEEAEEDGLSRSLRELGERLESDD
ncbi:helix-turn-helix domain-containing protein [Acutalibacter sp. 1XD8-33]|uniref:helix-turn-helix domain-containing protein n=1 Tax=Acutalibacter sp. 1XD8-33 TaxID=2320081 RepID=UPI000EA18157|nr:helix-turn-helix domain-containing protein [Acutalibacter sp. 1XD8-33]RKJ40195.1 helix-turn-helix domain-containing protein [Acutalibacter sp. 1XD8-33]